MDLANPLSEASPTLTASAPARHARLWRDGQWLHIRASHPERLKAVLRTRIRKGVRGSGGSVAVHGNWFPLFEDDTYLDDPVLKCWAGLTQAVLAVLRRDRVEASFSDRNLRYHAPLPAPAALPRGIASDSGLLAFVRQHDRGLIRYDGAHVPPALLVAQLVKAWPTRNVAVVAAARDDVFGLAKQLRAGGINAFGFFGKEYEVSTRCAVCTYMGLAATPVKPQKYDLVLALDAAHATAKTAAECLGFLDNARLYGLVDVGRQLSPHEEDLVRCLFGFEEAVISRGGYRVRPVEVLWADSRGRPLDVKPTGLVALKRHALWRNDGRNRQVARVGRACAGGDLAQIRELVNLRHGYQFPAGRRLVAVLVDNLEHAQAVMAKLPGWAVVASGVPNLNGMTADQRAALEPRLALDPALAPGWVITEAGLRSDGLPWGRLGVLIRADGGTGPLALPPAALERPDTEQGAGPLLVIDFHDRHDPELRRRTGRRHRAYLQAGWPPAGYPAATVRVSQFLKPRWQGVSA